MPAAAASEAPADAREAQPAPVVAATARPRKKAKANWSGVAPGETFGSHRRQAWEAAHEESTTVTLKMRSPSCNFAACLKKRATAPRGKAAASKRPT